MVQPPNSYIKADFTKIWKEMAFNQTGGISFGLAKKL